MNAQYERMMVIDQIGIAACGVSAIYLSQDARESWRRWACVFGLIGQPFWFWATWQAEQWGIFALCFAYAYSWARGIKTYWLKRQSTATATKGPDK